MYEPHLSNNPQGSSRPNGDESSLLEELDKIAPIKSFDAFPKVQSTYTVHSSRGGALTAVVGLVIFLLVLNDLGEYLYGAPDYAFQVDQQVERNFQLNVDLTVAMPCHYLTIDLRDAVGDRLHLSDDFVKDGGFIDEALISKFTIGIPNYLLREATHTQPAQKLFRHSSALLVIIETPCRIYGSVDVKKVTANLHVTTLGHGYMSFEHTDHHLMNLSHIVHEFSFGPFFPAISQPLDLSLETTEQPFTIFQYFLRVVPTTYIDASRRKLMTSQYAVTDYSRNFDHGAGIPGIFFKYDLEAMALTIRERTTTLYQFLIRLVGVVGGVWTVASFGLRLFNRAQKEMTKVVSNEKEYIPPVLPSVSPVISRQNTGSASRNGNDYFARASPGF
ncbi:MAG: hypothetical protein TREMPRED_001679 [Tremellales sp. Tagirdzhanova-0007]|nr:MAG: hypothetical protein TREMPRED_001679 [Tremellales sp. Tagirdzhanova-0007]